MSKVAQAVLDEFGRSVKRARTLNGWGHKDLAAQINPAPGRSFLCDIEKGKRDIGPVTVGKLIKALDLDPNWIDRFLDADVSPDAEETKLDRDAERLMRLAAQDETAPETAEDLLISLAQEYALGRYDTPAAAYNDLRATLQVAADLKARGMLPQNTSDQVTTLMRRVTELNDQGLRDEAATEVDTALADLDAGHAAQKSALLDIGIRQDRVRNNPASAAKRIIAQLRLEAQPGGLFRAIHTAWEEWFDRGYEKGVTFDLTTALHLARANLDRAKGIQRAQALADLGITQYRLGEREAGTTRLTQAIATFRTFLAEHPRKSDPGNWATGKNNLAIALSTLGKRETGTARLEEAVTACRAALEERTRDRVPLDWATSWGNMGEAMTVLADRTDDLAMARQALQQLQEAEAVLRDGGHETFATYSADRIPRAQAVIARLS